MATLSFVACLHTEDEALVFKCCSEIRSYRRYEHDQPEHVHRKRKHARPMLCNDSQRRPALTGRKSLDSCPILFSPAHGKILESRISARFMRAASTAPVDALAVDAPPAASTAAW